MRGDDRGVVIVMSGYKVQVLLSCKIGRWVMVKVGSVRTGTRTRGCVSIRHW